MKDDVIPLHAMRRMIRRAGRDDGAAAVEFAIVFVILILLVLAILDFGRLYWLQQSVKSASREAARNFAVVHVKTTAREKAVSALGGAVAMGMNGTAPDVTFTGSSTETTCVDPMSVVVTAKFDWIMPVWTLPFGIGSASWAQDGRPVRGETFMRCENASTSGNGGGDGNGDGDGDG